MQASGPLASVSWQGSGIGYRTEIARAIWDNRDLIDCLEIITDRYIEYPQLGEELETLCGSFRVIPHGIGLSVGSPRVSREYLRDVKRISDITKSPYYSEHLCMTRAPGLDIGHLSPLWFTEEVLRNTIANVHEVQDTLGKPLILENVTYPFAIPEADMTQGEFFHRLVDATGCGILLDVANVYINAANHGFSAEEFLDQMPLDRVVQLHMSGGYRQGDEIIDGHCKTPEQGIWDLLEVVARKTRVQGSILEHDAEFPSDFSALLETVVRTREILGWGQPATEELREAS